MANTPQSHWCHDRNHGECAGYFYRATGPSEPCQCSCHAPADPRSASMVESMRSSTFRKTT